MKNVQIFNGVEYHSEKIPNGEAFVVHEGVTEIPNAFFRYFSFTKVVLPSSLRKIGDYAFASTPLKEVVIPDSVTEIGTGAFVNCGQLKFIKLSAHLKEIKDFTFKNSGIQEIELNNELESIGSYAFALTPLDYIRIPDSVTEIGTGAFLKCNKLGNVKLPKHLKQIRNLTFRNVNIHEITMSEELESIGAYAFSDISRALIIKLPSTVKLIGESAFENSCSVRVLINPEIEYIGHNAFNNNDYFTKKELPHTLKAFDVGKSSNFVIEYKENKYTLIDGVLKFDEGVQSIYNPDVILDGVHTVVLPDSVEFIGSSTFSTAVDLKSVRFSKNLKYIGASAFPYGNKLENVELPPSIRYIGCKNFIGYLGKGRIKIPYSCIANRESAVFENFGNKFMKLDWSPKYSDLIENERKELESVSLLPEQINSNIDKIKRRSTNEIFDLSNGFVIALMKSYKDELIYLNMIENLIIEGVIDVKNSDKIISQAFLNGSLNTILLFMKYGYYSDSLLSKAVCSNNYELVRLLLMLTNNIDVLDDKGYTPLMLSISKCNNKIARLLIDSGANTNASCDNKTVLDIAIGANNQEMIDYLSNREVCSKEHLESQSDLEQLQLLLGGK